MPLIFQNQNIIHAQAFGILGLMRISCNSPVSGVEYVQAASPCAKPQHAVFILTDCHDSVAAYIPGILRINQIAGKCFPVRVKPVQPLIRSDPERS